MNMARTLPEMVFQQVRKHGGRTLFLYKQDGHYHPISWQTFGQQVTETAAGLLALGVTKGDRVVIMSYNRPEWAIADLAILSLGAVTVPIYHTATQAQVRHIMENSGARVAFVARSEKGEVLMACNPLVQWIITMDPADAGAGSCTMYIRSLQDLGRSHLGDETSARELHDRMESILPDDCATIIYTSGTTGHPKGVMLSHRNILADVTAGLAAQPVDEADTSLSFLPLSHVFERTIGQFLMMMAGAIIAYAESVRAVSQNIKEVRPTIVLAVPRFFEKIHERIKSRLKEAPALRQRIFKWAMETGRTMRTTTDSGGRASLALRLRHRIADLLVYGRIRAALGGRLRFFVSGGAPLSPEIVHFFLDAGIPVLEGYGLTEASPVVSVNRLHRERPGTVGPPLPGVNVRMAEDGEIQVRGATVMLGYFRDPDATDNTLRGGWLHTGDLGEWGADGCLRITGRKKDLIVTSGGKNVSPQIVEGLISTDELIEQVMVYGDERPYLVALVVPAFDSLRAELGSSVPGDLTNEALARDAEARELLMRRIDYRTRELAPHERVRKIEVLGEPFSAEKGELTPTLKLRRKILAEKYAVELARLYQESTSSRQHAGA